jgi:hypothetical protein
MRTDGRTDMTKLIVAFRNFANALKKPTKYAVYSEPSQFVFKKFCDYTTFFHHVSTVYDKTFSLHSELLRTESD